ACSASYRWSRSAWAGVDRGVAAADWAGGAAHAAGAPARVSRASARNDFGSKGIRKSRVYGAARIGPALAAPCEPSNPLRAMTVSSCFPDAHIRISDHIEINNLP